MLKKVLLIFISAITLGCNYKSEPLVQKQWELYRDSASIISHNDSKVLKLFNIAMSDKNLTSKTSSFDKATKKVFDEMHYASLYDYMIDGDENVEELIHIVFMIIITGFEYMEYTDWKNLSNPAEMRWRVNRQFKKYDSSLTKEEVALINNELKFFLKTDYSYKKHIDATNTMVSLVEKITRTRGLEVLWFQNNSDSYHFSIVKPNVFKALNNKVLMGDCSFNIPYFKLDM